MNNATLEVMERIREQIRPLERIVCQTEPKPQLNQVRSSGGATISITSRS